MPGNGRIPLDLLVALLRGPLPQAALRMCGIAAYLGPQAAAPVLFAALERLKYRGYDSAGIATLHDGALERRRAEGRLAALGQVLERAPLPGRVGIAHTRWATHGAPVERNAHPHTDAEGRVGVVHNGIIENHAALRAGLMARGAVLASDTDTEVIPFLIGERLSAGDDLLAAVRAVLPRLEGAYAFAAISAAEPGRIVVARAGSPLLIGRSRPAGDGSRTLMIASDIPALLPHAHEHAVLEDGQIAVLDDGGRVAVHGAAGSAAPAFRSIDVTPDAVDKGAFPSFMAKEIAEQPQVLARILDSRLHGGRLVTSELGVDLAGVRRVVLLACGTSWHASLHAKRCIEALARIPVEVDIASEYRYRDPVAVPGTLVVVISQSGETADTLAGLRLAKQHGVPVVGLVNVVTSTIAREADGVLPLLAGPEIGVASTKAYTAQLLALLLFACQLGRAHGHLDEAHLDRLLAACHDLPGLVARTLADDAGVAEASDLYAAAESAVFLGRGAEHPTALEGALKLKEIAYIAASGYPAGEFKHGPIALVSRRLPVIALCPRDALHEKMLSNIQEVRARSGRVIGVGAGDDSALRDLCDIVLPVATAGHALLQPLLTILPLQRYALRVALRRGCDVDQPRNLAKSVTVE